MNDYPFLANFSIIEDSIAVVIDADLDTKSSISTAISAIQVTILDSEVSPSSPDFNSSKSLSYVMQY